MPTNKKKHKRREADSSSSSLLRSSLKGGSIGLILSLILAVIISVSLLCVPDPDIFIFPLSLVALYMSAFVAGFIATKKNSGSALVSGLLSGGIFMIAYMLVSLFFPAELSAKYGILAALFFRALIIVFAILGGYAAISKPKKTHKPKRR